MNEIRFPGMAQDLTEFAWLLHRIKSLGDVGSILEIGVWQGGCLARFAHAFPAARVVGIDPRPMLDPEYRFPDSVRVVYGASQGRDDIRRTLSANDDRPFDVVVIDGDHTYDNAYSDWLWATIHARKMIALHDIASVGNPQIECRRLWEHVLTLGYRTEAIGYPAATDYGIGVVFLPQ